ncbi:MAG: hypothetical protein ABJL67_13810 [Sulfitobacter sp.]
MTMPRRSKVPPESGFAKYVDLPGAYFDCYAVEVEGDITLKTYANTFFDTWLFRLEILILRLFGTANTEPKDREKLADGRSDRFGVWHVDVRTEREMVLNVGHGPIRTWLWVQPVDTDLSKSLLLFGSAVLPTCASKDDEPRLDFVTRALIPVHRLYSVLLLRATAKQCGTVS